MRILSLTVALVATIAASLVSAQPASRTSAWKWRDASGQINISDLPPPPSVQAKDIVERPQTQRAAPTPAPTSLSTPVPNSPGPQALSGPRSDPELEARRKRADDEKAAQQRQQQERNAALRADNCSRAQAALAQLSDGQRIFRTNAQGEREVIDDAARASEEQRVRAVIASDCR